MTRMWTASVTTWTWGQPMTRVCPIVWTAHHLAQTLLPESTVQLELDDDWDAEVDWQA